MREAWPQLSKEAGLVGEGMKEGLTRPAHREKEIKGKRGNERRPVVGLIWTELPFLLS